MTENILDLIFCEFSEILLIKTWLDFNLPLVFRGQGVTRFLQRIPCGPWDHKRVVIRVQQLPGWTKESAGVPYSLPEKNYVHHPTVLRAFIWWVRFIIDYKYNYFVFLKTPYLNILMKVFFQAGMCWLLRNEINSNFHN